MPHILSLKHISLIIFFHSHFHKKLWSGSDQFESILWNESSTCIVINEEFFKKEVLERKRTFRIFEIKCMKSLVRPLNLMGLVKSDKPFKVLLHYLAFWKKKTMYIFRARYSKTFTYWQNVRLNYVTQKACSHM